MINTFWEPVQRASRIETKCIIQILQKGRYSEQQDQKSIDAILKRPNDLQV